MRIDTTATDERVLKVLGQRLAQNRLGRNLTQRGLAEEAGLGLRTVQRLESGSSATRLSGLVRVFRVLGLLARLDAVVPEASASPLALMAQQGRSRRRASRRKSTTGGSRKWTWGEGEP